MVLLSEKPAWMLYGVIACVLIAIIAIIMVAYARLKESKDKKLSYEQKHFELVRALLKGDTHSREESKQEALMAYPQWVATYAEIGKNATKKDRIILDKLKAKNS